MPSRVERIRAAVARIIAPAAPKQAKRAYMGARATRLTGGFGSSSNTSADAELHLALPLLRSRSRQMIRDSAYAKRAQLIVVNNVVGSGVGMQAQVVTTRGQLSKPVNDGIEAQWFEWAEAARCHTGGALHFHDFERAALGQIFEAGEVLVRLHLRAFGDSRVPLALELIEAERLADRYFEPGVVEAGNEIRMGVEVDRFGRAGAYWITQRHGADVMARPGVTDRVERVPADQIFHLRVVTRWPQTRGEPWMHAVLRKLDDLNEYSQHEVTAARASAAWFATIETPDEEPLKNDQEDDGTAVMDIEPMAVQALNPGEKLNFHNPSRPNPALDGFMRAMLREVAAGCGPSYESLSRDYSQSNYSSSRLALLDDRDLWRTLQQWWIRGFRRPLHRIWLRQAVLARAIDAVSPIAYANDMARYEAVLFKPRGWSWVDPTKEVEAYKEAVKAGFTTVTDVIAQTAGGLDIEDVISTRKRELEMFDEADIDVDTTVEEPQEPMAPAAATAGDDPADASDADGDTETGGARVRPLRRTA